MLDIEEPVTIILGLTNWLIEYSRMDERVKRKILTIAAQRGLARVNQSAVCRDAGIVERDLRNAMKGKFLPLDIKEKIAAWCGLSVEELFGDGTAPPPEPKATTNRYEADVRAFVETKPESARTP